MQKIYYLSTCDTCKRVMAEIEIPSTFIKQDIKTQAITKKELEELVELSGDYESLFSRRAKLYQERKLKDKSLIDQDFKDLILEHFTFLKRPVIVNKNKIFIGSSSKTVAEAKKSIHSL
ncbi:MAG TPA: ArsC/Spx/MgsR family protein [Aequorivita sp.]|nr:ArsC/Spx/MgsR family protein [Aequorivita sp.]